MLNLIESVGFRQRQGGGRERKTRNRKCPPHLWLLSGLPSHKTFSKITPTPQQSCLPIFSYSWHLIIKAPGKECWVIRKRMDPFLIVMGEAKRVGLKENKQKYVESWKLNAKDGWVWQGRGKMWNPGLFFLINSLLTFTEVGTDVESTAMYRENSINMVIFGCLGFMAYQPL